MQTRRSTRSSVLGKRPHAPDTVVSSSPVSSASTSTYDHPPTPDLTPICKRARTSLNLVEGDWNKENVAPASCGEVVTTTTASPRSLRRAASDFGGTPTRARPATLRHAATSDLLLNALATPPPTPAPTALLSLHARARALLRATTTTDGEGALAGREDERATIRAFLDCDNAGVLYISGAPGSGKTALVTSVLAAMPGEARHEALFVNCMALDGPDALWARLLEELGPSAPAGKGKGRGKKAQVGGREGVIAALKALPSTCVLVLDELDAVPSATLGAIFALPTSAPVRIVGIANTHTLSAASSTPTVSPSTSTSSTPEPAQVQTLHFAPYTPAQLREILSARLAPLPADAQKELFAGPTLGLLTKKVAALTGDVRVLFSVLRGAIEAAHTAASASPTLAADDENPLNTPALRVTVTPAHVLAALKTHAASSSTNTSPASSSAIVETVRALGLNAQLALLALLIAARRLAAGLPLAGPAPSPARTPMSTPKKPRSPTKRSFPSPSKSPTKSASASTLSAPTSAGAAGLDTTALHASYTALLARAEAFAPVSRSEFGDVLGMLEGAGLVALSSASAGGASPAGSPRKLVRTSSFGGSKALGGKSAGGGAVAVAEGVRSDELLRGLGIEQEEGAKGVREEEVCAIWERERVRLVRDEKALQAALTRAGMVARGEVFGDAMED